MYKVTKDQIEVVEDFKLQMLRKLNENAHKGDWQRCTTEYLIKRLYEEVSELEVAIESGDSESITKESSDVALFAMMIQDRRRLL